jgi:hypothetical protein
MTDELLRRAATIIAEHSGDSDLRLCVAKFVCNGRGADVWEMVKDQPDKAGFWLAIADKLIADAA